MDGVGRVRLGERRLVVLSGRHGSGHGDLRVLSYDHLVSVRLTQTHASGRGMLILTPSRGARIVVCYPAQRARAVRDLVRDVKARMGSAATARPPRLSGVLDR